MTAEKRTTADSEGQVRRCRSGVGVPVSHVLSDSLKLRAYGAGFLPPASGACARKTDSLAISPPPWQPPQRLALVASQRCLPRLPSY